MPAPVPAPVRGTRGRESRETPLRTLLPGLRAPAPLRVAAPGLTWVVDVAADPRWLRFREAYPVLLPLLLLIVLLLVGRRVFP